MSRESGEERFKSDLHDIWPAHSPGTLFRDAILSRRFRVCIKIATTANWISPLVDEKAVAEKKSTRANAIRWCVAHCRELDKKLLDSASDTIRRNYRLPSFRGGSRSECPKCPVESHNTKHFIQRLDSLIRR